MFYSQNALSMKKSEIRELLKLTRKPGIISFAGGLPAPDLFPIQEVNEIVNHVLETEGSTALQYGPTEGDPGLRQQLVKYMKKQGIEVEVDNILVTTSSQQGLDLVGKVFVSPGDIVMTGMPTYVGAIQAFNSYLADMHAVPLDAKGIDTHLLEAHIAKLMAAQQKPKFIYVVPDFQNPSGITMDVARRQELIAIAEKFNLIIIEDTPYRQLRFEGEHQPPIISMNSERVVSLFTFSKILLPGFRLGWMAGPEELIKKMVIAKQAVDLCSPPFNQAILAQFLERGLLDKQITRIVKAYREKRDFMLEKLEQYMPKIEGLEWTHPKGGLFLWVTLPAQMDSEQLFKQAVEHKVAYVIGSAFDPAGVDRRSFRVNFSYPSLADIEEGIKRLAKVVGQQSS
jgi:2-aminoadipate transaminase